MKVRLLQEKDFEVFKSLFDEAYSEYLVFLRHKSHQQYLDAVQEKEEITQEGFDFYVQTGSSFVAEEKSKVIGYVASQTMPSLHGINKTLWIEYIVVQHKLRRRKIGLALLSRLLDHARQAGIHELYATINPDNPASFQLALKAGFDVKDWKIATYGMKKAFNKRK